MTMEAIRVDRTEVEELIAEQYPYPHAHWLAWAEWLDDDREWIREWASECATFIEFTADRQIEAWRLDWAEKGYHLVEKGDFEGPWELQKREAENDDSPRGAPADVVNKLMQLSIEVEWPETPTSFGALAPVDPSDIELWYHGYDYPSAWPSWQDLEDDPREEVRAWADACTKATRKAERATIQRWKEAFEEAGYEAVVVYGSEISQYRTARYLGMEEVRDIDFRTALEEALGVVPIEWPTPPAFLVEVE